MTPRSNSPQPHPTILTLEGLIHAVDEAMSRDSSSYDDMSSVAQTKIPIVSGQQGLSSEILPYPIRLAINKESKKEVGLRSFPEDIRNCVYFITRNPDLYPESSARIVSIVETCMLICGLQELKGILTNRDAIVAQRLKSIADGPMAKRRYISTPQYKFVYFTTTLDVQQTIYVLDPGTYASLSRIASDYAWTLTFAIEIAMIAGISKSVKLPRHLVIQGQAEMEYFVEYIDMVSKILLGG
jgi:hypothetical protein